MQETFLRSLKFWQGEVKKAAALLLVAIVLQQGANLLALAFRENTEFQTSGLQMIADLSSLPPGDYYLSLGRIFSDTEIRIDGTLIHKDMLSLGVPISIDATQPPKQLTITRKSSARWKYNVFDAPAICPKGVGWIVQTWRNFVNFFLGPIASIFLLLTTIANAKLPNINHQDTRSHLELGIVALIYNIFLTGALDLLFEHNIFLLIHISLRALFSLCLVRIAERHARQPLSIYAIHFGFILLNVGTYLIRPQSLIAVYSFELLAYTLVPLKIMTSLLNPAQNSKRIQFLRSYFFTYLAISIFGSTHYFVYGPSSLSVWSPSMLAILTIGLITVTALEALEMKTKIEAEAAIASSSRQVAHDIKSPLGALKALLRDPALDKLESAALAKSAIERIDSIARDLLQKSKNGNRSQEQTLLPQELSDLIESVILEKQLTRPKCLIISEDLRIGGERKPIRVNATDLHRILSNLLDNGIHSLAPGTSNPKVLVSLEITGDGAVITVRDTGIGIPGAQLDAMNAGRFITTREDDNGLGLQHAWACVAKWNGQMSFESKLAAGTAVQIKLKAIDA